MPPASVPGAYRSRTRPLVAILLVTVGLAAFLAYEAFDSARHHRATAVRTIQDYANFAAWEFSANIKEVLYSTIVWAFNPIAELDVEPGQGKLPSPAILSSKKHKKLLCSCDSSRYYFRVDLRDDSYVSSGDTPQTAMRAWVLDTVPKHARKVYGKDGMDWQYAAIFGTVDGRPRAVVYQLKKDRRDAPVAAYGFELCLAEFGAESYREVMKYHALLPPSLTKGVPNDSLFSVKVSDAAGHVMYKSTVQYRTDFVGEHKLPSFGGIVTRVALRPELANSLVIGGLPKSRLPLLLGTLMLTIALAALGVQQLRREGELARIRSDFIASVSHELRTPLAQVRMFAETLLLGRVRSEDERVRSLQIIDQEARRLTHLVENILQFSRAERRAIHLTPVAGDIGAQVREAMEAFAPVARARRVTLLDFLEDDVVATVDTGALRQIVLNLLDNAVKYGPVGQTVTVRLARAGDQSRLVVEDQGLGIPPADRLRVWEPFQRLECAAQSAVAGSGIGLAVVAELVVLHNGRAWVEDAPARGARFIVEIPLSGVGTRDLGADRPSARIDLVQTPDARPQAPAAH